MYYYSVFIATSKKITIPLVYRFDQLIPIGSIVTVEIVDQKKLAVVFQRTTRFKKSIKYKDILDVFEYKIPDHLLKTMVEIQKRDRIDFSSIGQLLLSQYPTKTTKSKLDLPETKTEKLSLTTDQSGTSQAVRNNLRGKPQLLIGVTGSGKTRIYIDLAQKSLNLKLSNLILVPAIGLSRQVVLEFQRFIKQPIYHFHSNLTVSQKRLIWQSIIKSKDPITVIGPRSALFLPISNLGLIVIDEVHDDSFKQNNEPRYTTLQVASLLAKHSRAHFCQGRQHR